MNSTFSLYLKTNLIIWSNGNISLISMIHGNPLKILSPSSICYRIGLGIKGNRRRFIISTPWPMRHLIVILLTLSIPIKDKLKKEKSGKNSSSRKHCWIRLLCLMRRIKRKRCHSNMNNVILIMNKVHKILKKSFKKNLTAKTQASGELTQGQRDSLKLMRRSKKLLIH